MTVEINLQKVTFQYSGKQVLRNISISIPAGQYVAIVGKSGVGKTTLLRIIGGLEAPTSGDAKMDGFKGLEPNVQIVFQNYTSSLLPWMTVERNVNLGLPPDIRRKGPTAIGRKLLAAVGIDDSASMFPAELSGGMQQRAAIARALASAPEVLLLDEPFGALDTVTKQQLQDLLLSIWMQSGFTAVHVTHDIDEACYMADRVFVMQSPDTIADLVNPLGRPRSRIATRESRSYLEFRRLTIDCVGS